MSVKPPREIIRKFLEGGYPGDDIKQLDNMYLDIPAKKRNRFTRSKKRLREHLVHLQRWADD